MWGEEQPLAAAGIALRVMKPRAVSLIFLVSQNLTW
jgi:hypothetical protein